MTTDALLVQAFQALGHELPELAVELFEKVLHQEPGNPAVLLEIARCHLLRSCRGQAITALEKAEHADLDDLELHLELGRVWRQAGDADRACHWFRTIPPGTQWHGAALLEECLLKERQEEASFPENLARERWAGAPPVLRKMAEAVLAQRRGDGERARAGFHSVLEAAPGSPLGVEAGGRLARLLLRQEGGAMEAFKWLEVVKRWEEPALPSAHSQRLAARRAFDLATLQCVDQDWFARLVEADGEGRSALMILGHPRSGTSLLARLLSSRGWRWVDEAPAFTAVARELTRTWPEAATAQGMTDRLGAVPPEVRLAARRDYLSRVEDWGPVTPGGGPLLDKNPGLSCSIPILMALLPGWRAVYLLRDPRDVALSCYTQNFGPTLLGGACQTLEGAVEAVDHTLRCWLRVRELLPPGQVTELRYEDVAVNPDVLNRHASLRAPEAAGPAPVPAQVRLVENPSYAQIREAPHVRARDRWRDLPADLSKPLRKLREIAAAAGYPE